MTHYCRAGLVQPCAAPECECETSEVGMNKPAIHEEIHVGKWRISKVGDTLWIWLDGGEGGTFSEDELAKAIGEFYAKHF